MVNPKDIVGEREEEEFLLSNDENETLNHCYFSFLRSFLYRNSSNDVRFMILPSSLTNNRIGEHFDT